ncbi:MAG: septum formation initiator family protein [Parcubacteria group bacterium]|nr:septum formation initiator family protein [Parcubacteria group bacterium]
MFDFHERRKLKQYAYSLPTVVVLLAIVAFLGNSVWSVYLKEQETSERLEQRESYLKDISGRGEALEEEIDRLSSERGLEAELRSKFEVARSGEKVIVIVDAPEASIGKPAEKESFIKGLVDFVLFWN